MKKRAVVGFRAHSGWTTLVAVSLEGSQPIVLCRERVHLVKTFDFKFRQPYHTAEKLPPTYTASLVTAIALTCWSTPGRKAVSSAPVAVL